MDDGLGFLFRPVLAGMCQMESLKDGSPLELWDFVLMNEALDVKEENEYRVYSHAQS